MALESTKFNIQNHFRYIEQTEDDKEKLKGSYKVAKKLEKLENRSAIFYQIHENK